ncbi:hypothetical protein ACMHYO_21385 [Allopusillimonas ginsengisoli]|uniref:hypothetical protein n=1 Tax=Allopusillimonas ginsengisoli TaxID=453575 RepID=UPI0010C170C2|nr:hypothetical protein D7I39_17925 [Allopusillimonas ginsengisoli]
MPLLLLPILLVALVLGAVWLFNQVALAFGSFAGFGAILAVIAVFVALIAWLLKRYRAIHGTNVRGQRVLSTEGSWGVLRLSVGEKSGTLTLQGHNADFIFADIAQAQAVLEDDGWAVHLTLRHQSRADWLIPMYGRKQAKRWAKIMSYAATQKL